MIQDHCGARRFTKYVDEGLVETEAGLSPRRVEFGLTSHRIYQQVDGAEHIGEATQRPFLRCPALLPVPKGRPGDPRHASDFFLAETKQSLESLHGR
ncbi:MAG: hypothetical protein WA969_09680 [Candidatus Microthrix parvicella]